MFCCHSVSVVTSVIMEVDAAPGDLLLHRPWVPVNISGSQFLVKTLFRDSSYHILLTDMNCVWEERMDSSAIQRRSQARGKYTAVDIVSLSCVLFVTHSLFTFQELNKRLRAPVKAFFSHLCEVVQPCLSQTSGGSSEQTAVEAELSLQPQEDDSLMMRLKSELAGLPFHWKFHCTPAPVTLVQPTFLFRDFDCCLVQYILIVICSYAIGYHL